MSEQTNHEFRAETRKVLNILTHSLYSNREIFLRELISNASDALDKLRFLQGRGQETIRDNDEPLEIRISLDKVQSILTVTDSGIGMTHDEMIENLGTIAHSGSEAFLNELSQNNENSDASNIIGRWGSVSTLCSWLRTRLKSFPNRPQATPPHGSGLPTAAEPLP